MTNVHYITSTEDKRINEYYEKYKDYYDNTRSKTKGLNLDIFILGFISEYNINIREYKYFNTKEINALQSKIIPEDTIIKHYDDIDDYNFINDNNSKKIFNEFFEGILSDTKKIINNQQRLFKAVDNHYEFNGDFFLFNTITIGDKYSPTENIYNNFKNLLQTKDLFQVHDKGDTELQEIQFVESMLLHIACYTHKLTYNNNARAWNLIPSNDNTFGIFNFLNIPNNNHYNDTECMAGKCKDYLNHRTNNKICTDKANQLDTKDIGSVLATIIFNNRYHSIFYLNDTNNVEILYKFIKSDPGQLDNKKFDETIDNILTKLQHALHYNKFKPPVTRLVIYKYIIRFMWIRKNKIKYIIVLLSIIIFIVFIIFCIRRYNNKKHKVKK